MTSNRSWNNVPETYRRQEMGKIATWVLRGASGCVAGLPGVGKSNFLGFLCHRQEVIQSLLSTNPVEYCFVSVDLNNLPDETPANFYRVILRSLYEARRYFRSELQKAITVAYQEHKPIQDTFVVQSAVRELLELFREHGQRIVFVFDRFDDFCEVSPAYMTSALRGLRDSFKDMLLYVMGMRQEAAHLLEPNKLGELYEVIDTSVCWVGPMSLEDATFLITQETERIALPPVEEIEKFQELSGGIPALLKTICTVWLSSHQGTSPQNWQDRLLDNPSIEYRLEEIINGLSQEERYALTDMVRTSDIGFKTASARLKKHDGQVFARLTTKGICQQKGDGWEICSDLLQEYVANRDEIGRGRVWLEAQTETVYQGQSLVQDLTHLEREMIKYFLRYPRIRHTKTDLIIGAWSDEQNEAGVSDDSLYQVIAGLRKKLEPIPTTPCYILNWRGRPEGGYQFFPEGRPH